MPRRTYQVVPFYTGRLGGNLDERKLAKVLNEHGAQGWRFVRSIHETRRRWLVSAREAHFLVFEREEA